MGLQAHSRQTIARQVKLRNSFRNGNVSAIRYNAGETPHIGVLPSFLTDQLKGTSRNNDTYVVYSYQTPIGWSNCDGRDEWFIPDVTYSITTTHHQTLLKVITGTSVYDG